MYGSLALKQQQQTQYSAKRLALKQQQQTQYSAKRLALKQQQQTQYSTNFHTYKFSTETTTNTLKPDLWNHAQLNTKRADMAKENVLILQMISSMTGTTHRFAMKH